MSITVQNEIDIVEQLYISNLVYRFGPTKYKGQQYIVPLFEDEEWDNLYEQHKQEYQQFIKQQPTNKSDLPQIAHPVICGSLNKYTSKDYQKFIDRITKLKNCSNTEKDFVITPKYDGCSLRIYFYPNGDILCMSRNEQDYGFNLTDRCQSILNNFKKQELVEFMKEHDLACVVIRGELIISQEKFQNEINTGNTSANTSTSNNTSNNKQFASVQNYITSQTATMLSPITTDYICYEFLPMTSIVRGQESIDKNLISTYLEQLLLLSQFMVDTSKLTKYSYQTYDKLTDEQLFKQYYDSVNNKPYPCDGIVIKLNSYSKAAYENKLKPLYHVAYKFQQDYVEALPLQINWTVNSQFELVPTLEIEPTKVGPKQVKHISMSNLNKCFEYDIFTKIAQHKKVKICLAGSIIPQLSQLEKEYQLDQLLKFKDLNECQKYKGNLFNSSQYKQCYKKLNDVKPSKCPICGSCISLQCTSASSTLANNVFANTVSTTSTSKNQCKYQFKYTCVKKKCRTQIISSKFLTNFKTYLTPLKMGPKKIQKLIQEQGTLDTALVHILKQLPDNIPKSTFYITFCDDETEQSIKQKINNDEETELVRAMFRNFSVNYLNLTQTSLYLQQTHFNTFVNSPTLTSPRSTSPSNNVQKVIKE